MALRVGTDVTPDVIAGATDMVATDLGSLQVTPESINFDSSNDNTMFALQIDNVHTQALQDLPDSILTNDEVPTIEKAAHEAIRRIFDQCLEGQTEILILLFTSVRKHDDAQGLDGLINDDNASLKADAGGI